MRDSLAGAVAVPAPDAFGASSAAWQHAARLEVGFPC